MSVLSITPQIAFATTVLEPADEYRPQPSYVVAVHWAGVDRPVTHRISCGQNQQLARRLEVAMASGKVYTNARIATDTYGQTYVAADCQVMGRHLNRDLKALGF